MQAVVYMYLLTTTCLHNETAVITKMVVKSICLGVQFVIVWYKNKAPQSQKWSWHARFQVSVQINEILLYNKK